MRSDFAGDEFDEADFDEDEFDFDENEYYLGKKEPREYNYGKADYDFDKDYDRMVEYERFGPLRINSFRFSSELNNKLKDLSYWQKFALYFAIGLLIYFFI